MREKTNDDPTSAQTMFNPGRRETLRKLGMAAAAAAAPMILPARLLAQKTAKSDENAPSERLNLAVIGLGSSAKDHLLKLLKNPAVFVRAVCEVDSRRLKDYEIQLMQNYRKEVAVYGKPLATVDHREIMAREDIDGVVIATPDHWHAAIALDAIRSGKDVLIQSPMTLTIREGMLIEAAALHHAAIAQVAAPQRNERQIVNAAELVRNGYIGEVKEVYVEMSYFKEPEAFPTQSIPEGFDYDRWLGPAPFIPYHSARLSGGKVNGWRNFWEYGSRTHGSEGHDRYDIVQWALGFEDTGPVEFIPDGVNGAECAMYRYGNGTTVYLGHPSERERQIEFVGSQGTIGVSSRGQMSCDPTELSAVKFGVGDIRLPIQITDEDAWIQSIQTRAEPMVNAQVAHRSSSVTILNAMAEQLGRAIRWDPKKQEITGDLLASRMLDRPRRAPYTLV